MTQGSKINSSFAEFLEEKAALAFISFSSLFGLLAIENQKTEITNRKNEHAPSFNEFINYQIDNPIQRAIKAFILFVRYFDLIQELTIYDLKDYDAEFSFFDPPSLQHHHLSQALKDVYESPDNLKKYGYIGFKREQLEQVLGFYLLTDEQLAIFAKLEETINEHQNKQHKQNESTESYKPTTSEKELLEMIAVLVEELAKHSKKIKWADKFNKSEFARICSTSKMNLMFRNPKGEEAYRQVLKKLDIPIQ